MSAAGLLLRLGLATLAFTLLAGAMMLARRQLRLRLGASAAYALWLLVPLGVALCCWPVHRELIYIPALEIAAAHADPAPQIVAAPAAPQWQAGVLLVWLLGAAGSLLVLCRRQHAFVRSLGPLRAEGAGVWTGSRPDAGPVLVGLLRPRIVLPADFTRRYGEREQAAVLAHERLHRRRGDLWWNALAALLRCAFWFHPLAAAAQRRYLADQELACDSAVLRQAGITPRTYAEALLKTQLDAGVPLGCGMGAASSLQERIRNLGQRAAPRRARLVVALALAAATAAGASLAWAASRDTVTVAVTPAAAAAGKAYRVVLDISVDDAAPRHLERVVRGPLHLDSLRDAEGHACRAELSFSPMSSGAIDVRLRLGCDGRPVSTPRLLARAGDPVTVTVGESIRKPGAFFATTRGFKLHMKLQPA